MKILKFLGNKYQAEKIVKNENTIKGYINGIEVFSFEGISDFSQYQLLNGQSYDVKEITDKEKIENLEALVHKLLLERSTT